MMSDAVILKQPASDLSEKAASLSLLGDAYGWSRENIAKPVANAAIIDSYNHVAGVANWAAKLVDHAPVMQTKAEWTVAPAKDNSVASFTQSVSTGVGEILPYVAAAVVAGGLYKYSSTIRESAASKFSFSSEEEFTAFTPIKNNEIKFNTKGHIGGEDEGNVYDNLNGTVTKVFHLDAHDVDKTVGMYQRLNSIGANVPEVFEYGTTADGKPAMLMQKIGDGDHLRFQLISGAISGPARETLHKEYWGLADKLAKNNMSIDWNLTNMIFDRNKLYVVDPSYIKDVPMSSQLVEMFAGPIGLRK